MNKNFTFRVLIIKMSSMGDVIHALPALTDAQNALGNIEFDWVVEPGFSEIPAWHKAVRKVICAPLRHWRKAPWQTYQNGQWHEFIRKLRYTTYDLVIDAQGLVKSALICALSKGSKSGLDFQSAREPLASIVYKHKYKVSQRLHAVERARLLFSQALNYPLPTTPPDYGIHRDRLSTMNYGNNTIIFLHGTTWATKHWPESYWQKLGLLATRAGYQVLLPWGNEAEFARAEKIKLFTQHQSIDNAPLVLPKLPLCDITGLIAKAKGLVAVDTGLGHIAAAMAVPTISLYGPTDPDLTGAFGPNQVHLRASFPCSPCLSRQCKQGTQDIMPPCFESLSPEKVWNDLMKLMNQNQYAALST